MSDELKLPQVGELTLPQWQDWLMRYNTVLGERERHIEQLEAELYSCFHRIEELQAALREIGDCCTLPAQNDFEMREIARKALEGKDGQ
jgi:hypothetical protein